MKQGRRHWRSCVLLKSGTPLGLLLQAMALALAMERKPMPPTPASWDPRLSIGSRGTRLEVGRGTGTPQIGAPARAMNADDARRDQGTEGKDTRGGGARSRAPLLSALHETCLRCLTLRFALNKASKLRRAQARTHNPSLAGALMGRWLEVGGWACLGLELNQSTPDHSKRPSNPSLAGAVRVVGGGRK